MSCFFNGIYLHGRIDANMIQFVNYPKFPYNFLSRLSPVRTIISDFFRILFLFGLHIWEFSLKTRLVQLQSACSRVWPRLLNRNANTASHTTQRHTVCPTMLIVGDLTILSGFDAAPLGFGLDKWLGHLRGGVIHEVWSPGAFFLLYQHQQNASCPIKALGWN